MLNNNVVEKAADIIKKIDGWKTVIGAVGTPIASAVLFLVPEHTLAHKIALGFTIVFGSVGISGAVHKKLKGDLPSGMTKRNRG